MVAEKFQIYDVKIKGKYIYESKNLVCLFLLMSPRRNLSLHTRQKEITHSSQTSFSEDLFFPSRKRGGGRIMELKKLPKLNLRAY